MKDSKKDLLHREIENRFGVLPEFFKTAEDAPELIEQLWGFAKGAYLDLPIPSVFKERLFVYLSRFCEVRYCAVRHCGFLIGEGRPAGDANAQFSSIEDAIELLKRPYPSASELKMYTHSLKSQKNFMAWPEPKSEMESAIFGCASEVFLSPEASSQFRLALKKALGPRNFDFLMGYLAFIRTAHFWTLTHPELDHDEDMNALLKNHEELSKGLLEDPETGRCDFGQRFSKELSELRREKKTHEKLLEAQKKQIEMSKEIKKAKDFLESVIEIVPVGLSISEAPSGKALFNNKEIEDIAGVPIHTRVSIEGYDYGVRYLDGRKMPPDQYPSVRSMREGIKIHNEELFLINPKKGKRDLILSSCPVRDEDQKVVAVVTSVVDITEVKQAQRNLKDALAVRDEFLSIASHELKTPLTVLSLETEMIQIDLKGSSGLEAVKEYLEQVNTQVSRMVQLVDDMMDIARIRSGKLALIKSKIKLSALVNSVLRSLGHKFTKSIGGAIKVDVHEDILVNIDVGRMQQVLTNLLTNAQKYGRGGDIAINAGATEDGFYIKVKDHGIGIEKDKLELIFKRFERAINKNEVSGLGLGLYIVNQIVEAHGGKIHVTSKLGEGSEFCIEIPLKSRK